ncbi:PTS glucitol/sorbitol transporter subunit IIB [Tepidanaerobacter sp. GT38]|uniref:hypothetical protein n=1 Tax=Tepidanaerobacter sp. GT38 TaxID=2722793 RepID=UPI001F42233D|nr:PTS glucitol/sorbitol transporter subunit IIB [Tepidanaerobacter sp. GT38]
MKTNIFMKFSTGIGKIVSTFVDSGRESVKIVINTILPFMVFVSAIVGVVLGSGLGNIIADALSSFANKPLGLLILGIISAIPFISPILGPGAVIPQTIGVIIGTLIADGRIPPHFALPAIFAIHQPAGGDFIPVGLSLMEAESETAEVGVPAVLIGKFIVSPIEVGIALLVSVFIYR